MAWIYLAESEVTPSLCANGLQPSLSAKQTGTLKLSYFHAWPKGHCPELLYGMMSEPCLPPLWMFQLTSLLPDSLARISRLRVAVVAWKESEAAWFSRYFVLSKESRRPSCSWKTSRPLGRAEVNEWGKNWPRSGMIAGGIVYPLMTWERRTKESDGSCLLPTVTASSYGTGVGGQAGRVGKVRPSLNTMATKNLWPTPQPAPGQLNPAWVEWLMNFPLGWTELNDLGMRWYQRKQEKRSEG